MAQQLTMCTVIEKTLTYDLTKTKIYVEEMEERNNGLNGKQMLPITMGNQQTVPKMVCHFNYKLD